MNYLITGISGFVGPHLAKLLLKNGHNVTGLIRSTNGRELDLLDVLSPEEIDSINWENGDLLDRQSLIKIIKNHNFEGIFHLAAQSHPPTSFDNPVLTYDVNVMGSVNLISTISELSKHIKLMYCSTSEVYGDSCKDIGILDENTPIYPVNPYGASKAAIDIYMQERMKNGFIKGYITRAFSHTGPRRGNIFSISSDAYQLAKMILGKKDPILLVGNLKTKRAVLDVRDVVNAYYLLMLLDESNGQVFNVCDDKYFEMKYYTDILVEKSNLPNVEYRIHKPFYRPIDIDVQLGDTKRLKETTGWRKKISIEQTLENLLDYWVKKIG